MCSSKTSAMPDSMFLPLTSAKRKVLQTQIDAIMACLQ